MLQRWRAVDNSVSDSTRPRFEPQTFRSRDEGVTARPTDLKKVKLPGFRDVESVKPLLSDYVRNTLFAHLDEKEVPSSENSRYFPTKKVLWNSFLPKRNIAVRN